MEEAEFWVRLDQTAKTIQQATTGPRDRREAAVQSVHNLWAGVDSVRLASGASVTVDMRWLSTDLTTDNAVQRSRWVQALQDYHRQGLTGGRDRSDSLAALAQILKDPRFQYPEATPTPTAVPQQPAERAPAINEGFAAIAQAILVIVGLAIVAALILSFLRSLRIQRTALPVATESEDDPQSSAAADGLAAKSVAIEDYRQAIRYLYLSSLLELDEKGLLIYDRTLTNREHLRRITNNPALVEALRPVVNTFDRVWYGFESADAGLYDDFSRAVNRLKQIHGSNEQQR